jgi:hypothetical protein
LKLERTLRIDGMDYVWCDAHNHWETEQERQWEIDHPGFSAPYVPKVMPTFIWP